MVWMWWNCVVTVWCGMVSGIVARTSNGAQGNYVLQAIEQPSCALRFIWWNVVCLYGACYRWCVMVQMYGTRHRNYSVLLCYGTLTPYVLANRARGNCLVWYIMVLMWWNCCMVTHSMCRATERGQRHRKFPGQVPRSSSWCLLPPSSSSSSSCLPASCPGFQPCGFLQNYRLQSIQMMSR